ncbi:kinase-like protein [Schizopora paradoxa]|uniref:Kinase-like protein n=1 Tax=Schizopora paradoxa TaxID=27342 RepID=A0A0H2RB59_9AGAM|nr:kinase-like protein [Schizopora paradoxa]
MWSSVNENEERLKRELLATNADLKEALNDIKKYIIAATADGWIGRDDPIYQDFSLHIKVHEERVVAFCSFQIDDLTTRSVVQRMLSAVGLTKDKVLEVLEMQIVDRINEGKMMQHLLASIKKTTEGERSEKYSSFHDKLPRGKKMNKQVLSLAKDTSSEISGKLNEIIHGTAVAAFRSRYMQKDLTTVDRSLIPKADIGHGFKALQMEVDYMCFSPRDFSLDKLLRKILPGLVSLTRQFAVILNKYYVDEVGYAFAEIASDRFLAAYSEFAYEHEMLKQNLKLFIGDQAQRRCIKMQFAYKITLAVRLCSEFLDKNQAALTGMACSGENVARSICDSEEGNSVIVDAECVSMLKEDEDDAEFLANEHKSATLRDIPSNLEVRYDDIVRELNKLQLKKMELPFAESDEAARGSYATIREVPWNDSKILVAVKCFKVVKSEQRTMKSFVREAQIMSKLQHKNILSIFGYACLPSSSNANNRSDTRYITYALVYPMYRMGSLENYLAASGVGEERKVKILLDVAAGLSYMHDPHKEIGVVVHGDLRAANVLVSPSGDALLCDFGLSTYENLDEKWRTISTETNQAWLPYEFFTFTPLNRAVERKKLTVKTDIFAFGCVCYEVPFPRFSFENVFELTLAPC